MKRANSGLTWIRQRHVTEFLQQLAVNQNVTHDVIDGLPKSNTREFVRGLLVEHGVLPRRHLFKTRYAEWSTTALERLSDPANRDAIQRYIRWQHQRRMNQMDEVSEATFLRSKQTVTVAVDLLNWTTEQQIAFGDLDQSHLDAWHTTGPTTALLADRFLAWAAHARLLEPGLKVPSHRQGLRRPMSDAGRAKVIQRLVDSEDLRPRDRAAAVLVLMFGQQIEDVVDLTWDEISVTDELVTIRLGSIEIGLSEPLDVPWRALAAHPASAETAAHPNSNWVFPGQSPGRHISARHLRIRLRQLLGLTDLTQLEPTAVVGSPATDPRPRTHTQEEGDFAFRHSS